MRLTELAEAYRTGTHNTVASSCHRLQRIIQQDKKFAKQYVQIKKLCSQGEDLLPKGLDPSLGTGSKSSSIGTLTFTKSNFEPNEGLLGEEEPEFFVFKDPFQRQRETLVDELLVF